ncbi:hypothetical protein MD484_g1643, partial [Candolleomyces efflorescens]
MLGISYFENAKDFLAENTTFNTYLPGLDALQFLYEHAATGAMHDSDERYPPPLCHAGTREVVILRIKRWFGFLTKPDKPIMWIHAPAGYGKTAIAGTISKLLEEAEGLDFSPLGATFYFWRTSPDRNSPQRFIITIAYQLAVAIPELVPFIESSVKRNPMILRKTLETQVQKLIIEPFKALGELDDIPNRLIIVDGLDECIKSNQEYKVEREYAENQEKNQTRILDLINTLQSHQLPLSFLVLSRPEEWIKRHIQSAEFRRVVEVVDLYTLGDHLNDTETYIRAELSRIAARIKADETLTQGDDEWPGEEMVQTFVKRTNGHILYASTAIRHIDNPYGDPRNLLDNLIHGVLYPNPDLAHSSPFSSLHELYMQIMRSCPESNRTLMIQVLEDMSACDRYFSRRVGFHRALGILDRLAGRVPRQGFRAIRCLHAVLRVSDTRHAGDRGSHPSPFIHSSFSEFLGNPRLSSEFRVDRQNGRRRILRGCLDLMSKLTPESNTDDDHSQFALRNWALLFDDIWVWTSHESEYLQFMEKLLSIDLLACAIRAHNAQDLRNDMFSFRFPHIGAYKTGRLNVIVPQSTRHVFGDEPLVQIAVAHVRSAVEGSLVHFLSKPPELWPSRFDDAVFRFIYDIDRRSKEERYGSTGESDNQVLCALRGLNKHHPERILMLGQEYGDDYITRLETL